MVGRTSAIICAAGWVGMLGAAPPVLDAVLPPGGRTGTEFEATVAGKVEPWPCEVWCSSAGVTFRADAEKAGRYLVEIAEGVEPGPYFVRLFNAEGASAPRIFVVGSAEEFNEDTAAGQGSLAKPQAVGEAFPAVVNGRLEKAGEADFYQFSWKRGKRVGLWLEGHSLQSPIDPHLHLYDGRGVRLAMGNDRPGGLDPEIAFEVPADGDYTVAVMGFAHPPGSSVQFAGSAKAVYRLHVGEPGSRVRRPELSEPMPEELAVPIRITRAIEEGGRPERFEFEAKKGQKLLLEVIGQRLGSGIDPVMKLEDGEGRVIKEVDDTKTSADPDFFWVVPGDGKFAVEVEDRFGRGGEDIYFRMEVTEVAPAFEVRCDKSEYVVAPGKPAELALTVTRLYGHERKLTVKVVGLPDGVTAESPEVPEKDGAVKLKLTSAEGAKAASGVIGIEVGEVEGEGGSTMVRAVYALPTDSPPGAYLIDEMDEIWLTVVEGAPEK